MGRSVYTTSSLPLCIINGQSGTGTECLLDSNKGLLLAFPLEPLVFLPQEVPQRLGHFCQMWGEICSADYTSRSPQLPNVPWLLHVLDGCNLAWVWISVFARHIPKGTVPFGASYVPFGVWLKTTLCPLGSSTYFNYLKVQSRLEK